MHVSPLKIYYKLLLLTCMAMHASHTDIIQLLERKVQERLFPGAQLVIINDDATYTKNIGHTDYTQAVCVNNNILYDVASLTKVIATTFAIMHLVSMDTIKLDTRLGTLYPRLSKDKHQLTIQDLLTHTSGYRPCLEDYIDRNLFAILTPTEKLEYLGKVLTAKALTQEYKYSDFNFIFLGLLIKKAVNTKFEQVCEDLFDLIDMKHTTFNPLEKFPVHQIAPTEDDPIRHRLIHGTVHDEAAAALNGVAGHAGLFSTAYDLATFMRMLLNGGNHKGMQILPKKTVAQFLTHESTKNEYRLGWRKNCHITGQQDFKLSDTSFSHLGFTGNTIWADVNKKFALICLTNRVHPTRDNAPQMAAFRIELAAIVKEMFNLNTD